MIHILGKIKESNLFYFLVHILTAALPVIAKLIFTGNLGPNFKFYFFVVWLPLTVFSLSAMRGFLESALAGVLISGVFLVSFANYSPDPALNFQRQLVFHLKDWMVLAAILAVALQIVFKKMRPHFAKSEK